MSSAIGGVVATIVGVSVAGDRAALGATCRGITTAGLACAISSRPSTADARTRTGVRASGVWASGVRASGVTAAATVIGACACACDGAGAGEAAAAVTGAVLRVAVRAFEAAGRMGLAPSGAGMAGAFSGAATVAGSDGADKATLVSAGKAFVWFPGV